ncbi:TetR family transcriptional regulator C-terminal domain-containing protein [Actinophytocola sp.]|uniref:TetR family transcriptional regulator C-terminal domain-containing protein n=1 Tax=Actinophytocola sp. TaxID=1872138 RepID=UPI002ED0E40F
MSKTDGRLLRGARSRQTILKHAVDLASHDGLFGLSFGRLASDLEVGKSSVQTLFGSKQKLLLETIETAAAAFQDAVVKPALQAPRGLTRLRAMIDAWIVYAEEPLFYGGCFWAANLADFDDRPGPVHDALFRHRRAWRDGLTAEVRHAIDSGDLTDRDPDLTSFQLEAVLLATNTALRLGEKGAVWRARYAIDALLKP